MNSAGIDKKKNNTEIKKNETNMKTTQRKRNDPKMKLDDYTETIETNSKQQQMKTQRRQKINVYIKTDTSVNDTNTPKNIKKSTFDKKTQLQSSKRVNTNSNYKPSNDTPKKKKQTWNQNIPFTKTILSSFVTSQQIKLNELASCAFVKLSELSHNTFFQYLLNFKRQSNELIEHISIYQNKLPLIKCNEYFDYSKVILNVIESLTQKIENLTTLSFTTATTTTTISPFQQSQSLSGGSNNNNNEVDGGVTINNTNTNINELLPSSTITINDNLSKINYLHTKENSVSFEIPLLRKRAISSRIEQRLQRNSRKSSEEIERRMKEKIATAEKKKQSIKQFNIETNNKLQEKISEIKHKNKMEKKEKIKKIYTKLEKMNNQQQKILNDKIELVRKQHEKVVEINYLRYLEKENKALNIKKKLDISIERRNKYLQDKLNKTLYHRRYYMNNNNTNVSLTSSSDVLKENLINKIDQSYSSGLEAAEKKKIIESRFAFLQRVFNEDFIWELFEADYFNLDELYNLTSLTRFELLKCKLRKEKEIIDKLYAKHKNNTNTNTNSNNTHTNSNGNNTIYTQSNWNDTISNNGDDDLFNYESDDNNNNNNGIERRSKSFTVFREEDFNEVNYLFEDIKREESCKKKKQRKKKKKKDNKDIQHQDSNDNNNNNNINCNQRCNSENDDEQHIRNKLKRSLNSSSQKELRVLNHVENSSKEINKMKKFLVKSKSNGKYVQSKLFVSHEELSTNYNTSNINEPLISSPQKEKNNNHMLSDNIHNINTVNIDLLADDDIPFVDNPLTNNDMPIQSSLTAISPITLNTSNNNINNNVTSTITTNNTVASTNALSPVVTNPEQEKKEKIFHNLIQTSDLTSSNPSTTIMVNSDSLVNILEKNQITVRWCKICNMILPSDQNSNAHISKPEHQRIKKEYGLSIQEESNTIMVFQSIPGDINEDLKNERVNAIKVRVKKLKQKMSLRAVKHENFWSHKQDFQSPNKQRIQKLCFDIEKQILPTIKDYDTLENLIKDLIKILDQKIQNDLHILRQTKLIQVLVEVLKKPAACHKSEIKSLFKIMELIIKILTYFSSPLENRNYMIVTNRISVIADLLLWVLNKPSKIPLGMSFLSDLISIIIVHVKHRIPFEYLYMKVDTLEYLLLSNIPIKFKQKYYSLNTPIDLSLGFGSFSLVLLKSLAMFESLTMQININYMTKPVYIKQTKMSENILFMFEYSELLGLPHLMSMLLLSNGPIKPKEKIIPQPQTVISASILALKILNNISRIDLNLVQSIMTSQLNLEQMQHVMSYIISYSLEFVDNSDDIKELLHELLLLISYMSLNNEVFQSVLNRGEVTIIQHVCNLPFAYFSDKQLKDILFPTLINMTYLNERNTQILAKEINLEFIVMFLREKIQLEPILEEDLDDLSSSINTDNNANKVAIKINKEAFLTADNPGKPDLLSERGKAYSIASSTKSCHDMVTGVSDFILLNHRFPYEQWEKAQEYYSTFGKNN